MSTSRTENRPGRAGYPGVPATRVGGSPAESRVDAAHQPPSDGLRESASPAGGKLGPDPAAARPEINPAEPAPQDVAQLVRTQASQLAEHLRARQEELDHREAALNARAAQLDRDARVARLWLDERMAELEEQAGTASGRAASEQGDAGLAAEALAQRSRRLEEAEMRLEAQQAEIERLHREATDHRQRLDDEDRQHRQRLAAEQARVLAELDEKRRAICHRSEQLDQSRSSLERLRGELGRMHRETLEIRMATEELWGQLCGAAAPAAVAQSLSRSRAQLADHYRLANADLQQHREQLERLRNELVEQHGRLVCRKQQLDQWATASRREVQEQAARLTAQAEELDGREAELRRRSHEWHSERLRLQQEIRRLRAKDEG
jgi:chromosome segregation ATPase